MNNTLFKTYEKSKWIDGVKNRISKVGLCISYCCIFILLINLLISIYENGLTLPSFIFFLTFFLTLSSIFYGISIFIFSLPIVPGLSRQISEFFGISLISLDSIGFELTLGLVLALKIRYQWQKLIIKTTDFIRPALPWQLSLALIFIVVYGCLTIVRNLWQSGVLTSTYGVIFNVLNFRTSGWHDDFRPIYDCLVYGLAASLIAFMVPFLRSIDNRNSIVFRPLLAALFLSIIWAIAQSTSGIGGGLGFRADLFGIPAFGFQPDLHSFAGLMLLGLIGLFGYKKVIAGTYESIIVKLIILLSFVGLILSKSRSSLIIGVIVLLVLFFINRWRNNRTQFYYLFSILVLFTAIFIIAWYELSIFYKTDLNGFNNSILGNINRSSWVIQLLLELSGRELSNFNELSAALGERPEFYRAALRMLYFFPLAGVGVGSFFRNSIFEQLTASPSLLKLGGENAHNYFLQTLAEIGMVGGVIFAVAIFIPIIRAVNQINTRPALFALLALFLGNIFAHSFLVRENFLLASVFFALLYATLSPNDRFNYSLSNRVIFWFFILLTPLILFLFGKEFLMSFDRHPFRYGQLCYVHRDVSADGWTSGSYELSLPIGASIRSIEFDPLRPEIFFTPLKIYFEITQDGVGSLEKKTIYTNHSGLQFVIFDFNKNDKTHKKPLLYTLKLSSCFTPKNFGISLDARRLGINIKEVKVNDN